MKAKGGGDHFVFCGMVMGRFSHIAVRCDKLTVDLQLEGTNGYVKYRLLPFVDDEYTFFFLSSY